MEEVVKTSIEIPREVLAEVKSLATRQGTTQNKIMNELIANGLKTIKENNGKIKAKLVKLPKAMNVTKEYDSLKDMAGIVEIDENIDVNEIINNVHFKKELY
jgi:5-bromo-4-chloroindolyl phosphate hydrolysis protein